MGPLPLSEPVRVFISYARADAGICRELVDALRPQEQAGTIRIWFDREIGPGDDFRRTIEERLPDARLVLLIVTPNFLASDWVGMEVRRAMDLHRSQKAVVVPIIIEPCPWQDAPFAVLQALPRDGRPLAGREDRENAVSEIVQGVAEAAAKARMEEPDATLRLLTNEDIRGVIRNIDMAVAEIRKAYAVYHPMPVNILIDLAQMTSRRDYFYGELRRRGELL